MKIHLINHYAVPPTRSGGTRHYSLAKELIARGHDVTVIACSFDYALRVERTLAPGQKAKLEKFDGVPFLFLRGLPYRGNAGRFCNMVDFARRVAYGREVRDLGKPDVVIGSSLTPFAALAGLRIARREEVPFVLEIRDVWPATLIDFGMSRWHPVIQLFAVIEKRLYSSADAIVTLLPGAVDHMRAHGAQNTRIEYIPNGVDFAAVPAATPPLPSEHFKVLYAGSFVQANCLPTLLDAAALLQARGRSDIEIHLLGSGPEKAAMLQRIEHGGLRNIVFHEPVPKSEVWAELGKADAFVTLLQDVPLYRFGISLNKLFDYMASARPIIYSGKSCNDPVSESGGGIAVPPEDAAAVANAIEKLASLPPEERRAMGLRAREYAEEHHNFRRLAETLESVCAGAVARNKSGADARSSAAENGR